MGLSSLLVHKLRSLLTMLGMIFGVGAVVAMLSITAGAQKEMMSYIDLLGSITSSSKPRKPWTGTSCKPGAPYRRG